MKIFGLASPILAHASLASDRRRAFRDVRAPALGIEQVRFNAFLNCQRIVGGRRTQLLSALNAKPSHIIVKALRSN
jgi:hypothetical protein